MKVGERTNTDVALMYIEGLADDNILTEIERRIEQIDFDGVLESGYIEQFIEDTHGHLFRRFKTPNVRIK